jgi:outer membrane immunogenic protein
MRRLECYLTGTTAALALSLGFGAAASAADLGPPAPVYTKAPAALPPTPYIWTGCFIGGQAGYGWGQSRFSDPTGGDFLASGATVTDNTRGGLVGGQIGCDYQFSGQWVAGLEVADAWAGINSSGADVFFDGKNEVLSAKTDQLGSVTGRFGYAWDSLLFYAKGGGAWAHNIYDLTQSSGIFGAASFSGSDTRLGWTAGGGIEWALAPKWSTRVEFNYYDLGTAALNLVGGAGGTYPASVKQEFESVTVGINYRFGR